MNFAINIRLVQLCCDFYFPFRSSDCLLTITLTQRQNLHSPLHIRPNLGAADQAKDNFYTDFVKTVFCCPERDKQILEAILTQEREKTQPSKVIGKAIGATNSNSMALQTKCLEHFLVII